MQHTHMRLNRRDSRLRKQAGFTVMELLVASLLGVLVLGTVNSFTRFQLFALRNQAVQNDIQMVARSVSDVFARDVRRSGFNPLCAAGVEAVDTAKPRQLILESDLDGDGTLDGTDERLTYRVVASSAGDRFERVANGRTDVLIDNIDLNSTLFRYFNNAGAEVSNGLTGLTNADRANVRRVRFEMQVAADPVDPTRALPVRVQLANDVDIRNRHFVNTIGCP